MNPIQRQQTHIQSFQALKKHDSDGNGRITAAEIKARMDTDQEGQLSKAEFERAGISDAGLQQDIQKKYRQGQAQPELPLFRTADLEKRSQGLQKTWSAKCNGQSRPSIKSWPMVLCKLS